jgi:hypothetical protein
MEKSVFKALRSQYRALRADGFSMKERIKSLGEKQELFSLGANVNFQACRKPDSRTGIVSIRVADKLDFPSWCFDSPKFN